MAIHEFERLIDPYLSTYLGNLYGPITDLARAHTYPSDVLISKGQIREMYKDVLGSTDLIRVLKTHGNSMNSEARSLTSALLWIKYHPGKEAQTGSMEIGDKTICYQNRKINGIVIKFNKTFEVKEAFDSMSQFRLAGQDKKGVWKTLKLEKSVVNFEDQTFVVRCIKGSEDPMLGSEHHVVVLEKGAGSDRQIVAAWSGNLNLGKDHMINNGVLWPRILKGVRSPSGDFVLDILSKSSSDLSFHARYVTEHWHDTELSRYVHMGPKGTGMGVYGLMVDSRNRKTVRGISAVVDDLSMHRAPGTFIVINEHTVDFNNRGGVKGGKQTEKRFEFKRPKVYMHMNILNPDEDLNENLNRLIKPVIDTLTAR